MKILSRISIFVLALLLLTGCRPALGEGKAVVVTFDSPVTLQKDQTAAVRTQINAVQSGTIVYSLTDMKRKTVLYTETRTGVQPGQELSWPVLYDIQGLDETHSLKQVRASFVLDEKTYHIDLYYHFPASKDQPGAILIERDDWFYNNTACSFGPAFRDVRPGLTEKWYCFTPVDLTLQGRQEFEYVASNMYIIGKVYVDVNEDSVTVTYHNYYADQGGRTETKEEFFTFFPDLSSVSQVEPERLQDQAFVFGVPLSIERDLGGDTNVLLFVRNKVTYCNYVTSARKLSRFWPNSAAHKELRENMIRFMGE